VVVLLLYKHKDTTPCDLWLFSALLDVQVFSSENRTAVLLYILNDLCKTVKYFTNSSQTEYLKKIILF